MLFNGEESVISTSFYDEDEGSKASVLARLMGRGEIAQSTQRENTDDVYRFL
jgi:hypothetical protein